MKRPSVSPGSGGTGPAWELGGADRSVVHRFQRVVDQMPRRPAVADGDVSFSYAELDRFANGVARAVLDAIGPAEEPAALMLDAGARQIGALLGILKAGKFYVPIDPGTPQGRAAAALRHAGCRVVVTTPKGGQMLDGEVTVVDVGVAEPTGQRPAADLTHGSLFNLIYTSGSTGAPKGVLQTHGNVLHDVRSSTGLHGVTTADRFGLIIPVTFGASVSDIFGALLNGAGIAVFDSKRRSMAALAAWMLDERITITHAVPTVFRHWMAELTPAEKYPDMRVLKLGGESVHRRDVEMFSQHFTADCVLRNGLGTTETYLVAANHLLPGAAIDGSVVPVGWPVAGLEVAVVGNDGDPLPAGEVGQITVKGLHLSPGYWRDPESTAKAFLADPAGGPVRTYLTGDLGRLRADGSLEHLGRMDDVVKIRGMQVDVAEVELALVEQPDVAEAAVVAQPNPDGSKRLVGYIVPDGAAPTVETLRRAMADTLADHMIPAAFVILESFPLLPFGKIDRRSLPVPDSVRPNLGTLFVAPRDECERNIAEAATAVLGLDRVGVDDDLFDLGLDSLGATRLLARISSILSVELPIEAVFESPTVAGLAARVTEMAVHIAADPALEFLLSEIEGLDDAEALRLLEE